MQWMNHLIIAPILLPLLLAGVLMLVDIRRHRIKVAISFTSVVLQLLIAAYLFSLTYQNTWPNDVGVYQAANWPAPFNISLVLDRLSAMMLILSAVVALAVLLFSWTRWSRSGIHFHSLLQFLLMGINGSFLTADLFNLFVFFEVMLAASYGLILNTYTSTRIRAGLQYIAINLVASCFFLLGIALIYAATGSLSMADIANKVPDLLDNQRLLMHAGASLLAVALLTKCAMWPLGFWLPTTYSANSAPVAALLALLTKVGVFVVLRLWTLTFSADAGDSAFFGSELLFYGGIATLIYGSVGLLASQEPMRMASFSAIISTGILLSGFSYAQAALNSAGLYYLISSTLGLVALILLIELVERIRTPSANLLAITMEAFAIEDSTPEEAVGVTIPAAMALMGLAFFTCALIIAGLPPFSGFVAKFGIFHGLLNPAPGFTLLGQSWFLIVLIFVSGLAAIIALMRFGVRTFWAFEGTSPRLPLSEIGPVYVLLGLCIALTLGAGIVFEMLAPISQQLENPKAYIDSVLSTPSVATAQELIP